MNKALICTITAAVGFAAALVSFADNPAPAAHFQVVEVHQVGGEGRWDYITVDPATELLYVTRQTHAMVLKASNGNVVANIESTPGAHGVALAAKHARGFISCGNADSVAVFDMKTNERIGEIPVGRKPDAIIYDPALDRVLVCDGKSNDVAVIDPAAKPGKKAVVGKIGLDGAPEFAVVDGAGHLYVNLEDRNSIDVVDLQQMKVINNFKIDGGEGPSGLAIDTAHRRLFSGCANKVMAIIDADNGSTLARLPIGDHVDACAFDPLTGEAFASCGDGTLTVVREVSPAKFEVVQTLATRPGARTMALDPTSHAIYLPTADLIPGTLPGERPQVKVGTFSIVVVKAVK